MAVTSARNIVNLKEAGHFERENARANKYTLADELPGQLAELSIRSMSVKEQPSYTIRKISPKEKDRMIDFLRKFFFRDEPLNLAVNLLETPSSRCLELEEYVAASLDDGVSIAAVDENGDYVGVVINGLARREEQDEADKSSDCPNPKFKRILQVLSHLEREAKIWERLPNSCNTVLEVRIASTHTAWRGRGLMRVLCTESERLAREVGAGGMRMDATSIFSAAAAERLGYKRVYAIEYEKLEFAPQPKAPHIEASVYIKEFKNQAGTKKLEESLGV